MLLSLGGQIAFKKRQQVVREGQCRSVATVGPDDVLPGLTLPRGPVYTTVCWISHGLIRSFHQPSKMTLKEHHHSAPFHCTTCSGRCSLEETSSKLARKDLAKVLGDNGLASTRYLGVFRHLNGL